MQGCYRTAQDTLRNYYGWQMKNLKIAKKTPPMLAKGGLQILLYYPEMQSEEKNLYIVNS